MLSDSERLGGGRRQAKISTSASLASHVLLAAVLFWKLADAVLFWKLVARGRQLDAGPRRTVERCQVAAISGPMALPSFVGVDEVRLRAAAATAAVLTLAALFFPHSHPRSVMRAAARCCV